MATLPTLVKDASPPATDTQTAPITIVDGTILITTKQWNEVVDIVSGDSTSKIPVGALEFITSLTASGTNDLNLSLTTTLNDSDAGGSDLFNLILGNIVETDATGWDIVNLMDLQVGGASRFTVADSGTLTINGTATNAITITETDSAVATIELDTGTSAGLISIYRNGSLVHRLNANNGGESVFNEASLDIDTRFEGSTEINLLKIDAGTDNLGIATATFGSTMAKGMAWALGTAPTTDVADQISLTVIDQSAGNAAFQIRAEGGEITSIGLQTLLPRGTELLPVLAASASSTTGVFFRTSNTINLSISGDDKWSVATDRFYGSEIAFTAEIWDLASTATLPVHTFNTDSDNGLGRSAADKGVLIAGAFPMLEFGNGTTVTHSGQQVTVKVATGTHTTNSGTGTETISNVIPAGSLILGISTRVTTILAGAGLTTFGIGDGTDIDAFGATIAIAAGTTTDLTDYTITTVPIYPAVTSIVLTADAGQFDSGVIRFTIHYIDLTAATS